MTLVQLDPSAQAQCTRAMPASANRAGAVTRPPERPAQQRWRRAQQGSRESRSACVLGQAACGRCTKHVQTCLLLALARERPRGSSINADRVLKPEQDLAERLRRDESHYHPWTRGARVRRECCRTGLG